MKSAPGRPPDCRLLGPPFLVLVQGFSIKVLMQKYCLHDDSCSRTRILTRSGNSENIVCLRCVFSYNDSLERHSCSKSIYFCGFHVSHFRTRVLYKKCSCRTCVQLLQNRYRQRMCILVQGLSIKAPMSQIKIIFAVFKLLILVQKVLMTGTPGYTT